MRSFRTLIPLSVILVLGAGVACKKPAPAPEPVKPVEAVAPTPAAENNTAERDAADAARRKAEAEAEAARKAAAEAEKAAAFKRAAEAALLDINYDYDKSDIREMDKAKLQAIADFLKAYPDVKLQLAGNCDERGTVEYNLALGERRAHAAQSYLVGLGVDAARLTTISYGKEKPKAQGHDEESWLINRNCQFSMQ
jgi:peptidoglycan-associated lipoprotein